MTPKRLSDSEKQEIASSYGGGGVTMASLAKSFGVSASTISRVLRQLEVLQPSTESETAPPPEKASPSPKGRKRRSRSTAAQSESVDISDDASDAEDASETTSDVPSPDPSSDPSLDQLKPRRTRKRSTPRAVIAETAEASGGVSSPEEDDSAAPNLAADTEADEEDATADKSTRRRSRRRSSAPSTPAFEESDRLEVVDDLADGDGDDDPVAAVVDDDQEGDESDLLDEDLDEGSSLDDDYGDDDEDEDEDDEDGDDEDEGNGWVDAESEEPLQVFPFADVSLPNPCYLVVDRSAELITRPLKEFRELGVVPDDEADLKTLPVFDNHRIARRFSARNQRVIKVPDSGVFLKTGSYLQAKKICRLLVDGRVYAL